MDTQGPEATAPRPWPARAGWTGLALVALLAAGGAASRPGGAWQGAPTVACAVAILLAVLALRAACDAPAGRYAIALLPLAAAVLIALPLPGVRALSGPPLLAVAAGAAVLMLARAGRTPPSWCFLPLVLLVYCGVAVRAQRQVGPEGDEPHYLMVADSLLRDHDLALDEDYAQGRYRAFHPAPLEPHYRVRGARGEILSVHAIGLSLLVLPAYALGGYAGASFFMALLAALLAREVRELVRIETGNRCVAEGCGWLVALSPPLVHYAGLIFTEVPAALVAALALRLARGGGSRARTAVVALGLAFLPWLHVRYVALAAVLILFLLFTRPRRKLLAPVAGAAVVSALALMAYHGALYGFLDPRRVWGQRPELSLSLLPQGLQGLLLDQEFGLLAYSPVFVLFGPGAVLLWRRSRRTAAAAIAVLGVALVTAGAWPMWRGGFNPPARFLLPALPALALGLAAVLRGAGTSAATALLAGWSLWAGLTGAWQPRLVHRDRDGTAPLFRTYSGAEEWTRLLPGYVLDESAGDRTALAAVWGIALLAAAAAVRGRGTPAGLGASIAGLAAAAAAASVLSTTRTGGRDAVRVVGRPALELPQWHPRRSSVAAWGPEALTWGPAFEPHRYPGGAELGSRLPLRAGRYRLHLEAELPPGDVPNRFLVRPEGPVPPEPRSFPLTRTPDGLEAAFDVREGEMAATLLLDGGPLFLRQIMLAVQPPGGRAGPIDAGGVAAARRLTPSEPR